MVVNVTQPRSPAELPSLLTAEIERLDVTDFSQSAAQYIKELLGRAGTLREKLTEDEEQTKKLSGVVEVANGELPACLFERARNLLLARLADD